MTRGLRLFVYGLTTLLISIGGLSPRQVAVVRTVLPFDDDARPDGTAALPEGFAATIDRTTSDQFVRVVVGDVDRDGDIDVVASLGSLDLAVWQNDGDGHFTRLPSTEHVALRTQPAAPSVHGDASGSIEWIQTQAPRGIDLDALRLLAVDTPERPFTNVVFLPHGRRARGVRSSRAPPLA